MVPPPKDVENILNPNMLAAVTSLYAIYHVFSLFNTVTCTH